MNLLAGIAKLCALYACLVIIIAFYRAVSNPDDTPYMRENRYKYITEEDMVNAADCIRFPPVDLENPLENKHLWPCYGRSLTRKQLREKIRLRIEKTRREAGYTNPVPALPPSAPRKHPERRKEPEPGVQYHYASTDRRQTNVSGLPDR